MGDCQNYGPFLGPHYNTGPNTGPNLEDSKRDHDLDNPPCVLQRALCCLLRVLPLGLLGLRPRLSGFSV